MELRHMHLPAQVPHPDMRYVLSELQRRRQRWQCDGRLLLLLPRPISNDDGVEEGVVPCRQEGLRHQEATKPGRQEDGVILRHERLGVGVRRGRLRAIQDQEL